LLFSEIGQSFINAETDDNLADKIKDTSKKFNEIADIEEEAFNTLSQEIK
jgi:hypothetical protein